MRVLAGMSLFVGGCETPEPEGAEPSAPAVIRVQGADALTSKLLPALVETYQRTRPGITFEVQPSATSEAIRGLLDGKADLVASGRPARPSEDEQAQVLGFTFDNPDVRHIVAVDVVAVAVHPQNPLQALTYDQVISVFCTRTIESWAGLGLEDRPIRAIAPDIEAGPRALSEDFFCGPKGIHEKIPTGSADEIRKAVQDDPDTITFVSAADGAGKLLALTPDPAVPPIKPTQDNIIRGAYPLYGDLYLFTRGRPSGDLASFLDWIESPAGQEVVDEQRFVPLFLRPERLDEPRPLRETVHFEPESATPNARSLARLDMLVQELRERQIRHVVLEGYTDDREPDPFALSEMRAQAVRSLLAKEVPELYFEIIPRGPKAPIAPNDTPLGRDLNRRVQVYLAEDEHQAGGAPAPAPTPPAGG